MDSSQVCHQLANVPHPCVNCRLRSKWLTVKAAGIQQVTPALDYAPVDIARMLATNYTGVFLSARACARQMYKYKVQGSICLIASVTFSMAIPGDEQGGLIETDGTAAPRSVPSGARTHPAWAALLTVSG